MLFASRRAGQALARQALAGRAAPARGARTLSSAAGEAAVGVTPSKAAGIACAAGLATLLLMGGSSGSAASVVDAEPAAAAVAAAVEAVAAPEAVCAVDPALEARVKELEKGFAVMAASAKNQAFVFLKPHAVTDKVDTLVVEGLGKAGVTVVGTGLLTHDVIDEQKLIDKHYGAIASKAVLLKPKELNVPDKGLKQFKEMFGEEWTEALAAGKVMNAADACVHFGGITGNELDAKWGKLKRGESMLKFGGGFYVGKVEDIFVMNGFYMAMRGKYCEAPAKLRYYVVEWNPSKLSWSQFRNDVLGGTDPAEAAPGSLRRVIYEQWEALGLPALPDVGDNGVHASASPFEACAERINWVGATAETDAFGKAALALGVPAATLQEWMGDAQVLVGGKKTSIFDELEDLDTADVLAKLQAVVTENVKVKSD